MVHGSYHRHLCQIQLYETLGWFWLTPCSAVFVSELSVVVLNMMGCCIEVYDMPDFVD